MLLLELYALLHVVLVPTAELAYVIYTRRVYLCIPRINHIVMQSTQSYHLAIAFLSQAALMKVKNKKKCCLPVT